MIFCISLSDPEQWCKETFGRDPHPEELPEFRQLTDIYWVCWAHHNGLAGTRVQNTNTYIAYCIRNEVTEGIIGRAIRGRGKEQLELWPGEYFMTESKEGLALLGSSLSTS